jgi:hypothetical protein
MIGASRRGSCSGGIEQSASHITRSWPRAASMPRRTAAPLPRFGICFTSRRCGMRSIASSTTAHVRSREPSSTTTISQRTGWVWRNA